MIYEKKIISICFEQQAKIMVTLVVLAAGNGTRFGGLKQFAHVDDIAGKTLLHKTLDSVFCAGNEVPPSHHCNKKVSAIIFVVQPSMEDICKKTFASVFNNNHGIPVEMCFQSFPHGTAHAVWCAREQLKRSKDPFVVINADDYYGPTALNCIIDFLTLHRNSNSGVMVGYLLSNTIPSSGKPVNRAVCKINGNNELTSIVETSVSESLGIDMSSIVSMNLFGFSKSHLHFFDSGWAQHVTEEQLVVENRSREFTLPEVVDSMIKQSTRFRVLVTDDRWVGVTYREDMVDMVVPYFSVKKSIG